MPNVRTRRLREQSTCGPPRHIYTGAEIRWDWYQSERHSGNTFTRNLPCGFSPAFLQLQGGPTDMADEAIREVTPVRPKRALDTNLLNKATLAMLLVENAEEITEEAIYGIMRRYVSDQSLTEEEYAMAEFINDCVMAREHDGLDHG
ncbi:uncharacterized protein METZ01_LOCUS260875 [marine metagenome]|uniref:Uncharacterized protein n=1 Tax=marine metagenome TaxID=408172 RepID=A0A382JB83_9ZZZZ